MDKVTETMDMLQELKIDRQVAAFGEAVIETLADDFARIDRIAEYNQQKVLVAMQKNRVNADCFHRSSGYGYNDFGRDTLEGVYADIFHTDAALVRPQITCGTHALTIALQAILRPGDILYSPASGPYDTLEEVIGIRPAPGSLREFGIDYLQTDLREDGSFDLEEIRKNLEDQRIRLVTIQRSKGYQVRHSFSVEEIGSLIRTIREVRDDVVIMVDNCYGEFVERIEPTDVGADMVVGSLIKNPGGGLAPIGGYIAGRSDLIDLCSYRMNAPGLGREVGASLDVLKDFYQGLFLAPTVVASALKTAVFASACYEKLGFAVVPGPKEERTDIIQSIVFGKAEGLIAFARGIQKAAPVDSYVTPEPWDMPGYDSEVIMAAGAFVQGSSIELSADGPLREPYAAYFQGALTWPHGKTGILMTMQSLLEERLVSFDEV